VSRLRCVLMMTVILMVLISCGSLKVSHDYDPGVDFDALKTYDWIPMEDSTDPSQLVVKRVVHAVNTALAAKGLELNRDDPDFMIGMQISGKSSYGGSTGVGASVGVPVGKMNVRVGGSRSKAREKREGTLSLDFIEPQSKSIIWRGTATSTVNPNATPQEQQALIDKAVSQMLDHFPPRP
jgi:hypothetical protein